MPNQQVVIEFVGDYSKLQTAGQELAKSGIGQQQVDQFNALNKATETTASNVSQIAGASKEAATGMDKLAAATNNAAKGIVGAAGASALNQLKTAAGAATTEIGKLSSSLEGAKSKLASLPAGSKEFNKLSQEIKATDLAMSLLGKTTDKLSSGTASIREQTRAFTNTLVTLKQAGLDNTEVYNAVKQSLAELSLNVSKVTDEIGGIASETKNLQGVVEIAEGVAGGFEAAAGASALFGEKSDDLEKSTQRIFAIMALANGIQKVYNTTLKESAAVQLIVRAQTSLQAVATQVAAAAESEYVIVRYAAAAAQAVLNAVMAANPVLLLIGGFIAAGAALVALTGDTDRAAEQQKKFNEELKQELDYFDKVNEQNNAPRIQRIKDLQNELTVLKSKNVSQNEILAKEKEIANQESALANNNKGFYAEEIKDLSLVNAQLDNQRQKLIALQHELDNKQSGNFFTRWLYGERKSSDIEKDIENTKSGLENLQHQQENGLKAQEEAAAKVAEEKAKQNEIDKHNVEENLKSDVALAQARLSRTKKTTEDELNAEIGLIERKQALELNDANLTGAQRLAIIDQNERAIKDLRYNYALLVAKDNLGIFQAEAAARLQLTNKDSDDEFAIQKELLIRKRDVDLLGARDNELEKQRIQKQFLDDFTALSRAAAKTRQLNELDTQKLTNDALLSATQEGTVEELNVKVASIKLAAQYDIAAIDERVKYTEKGQAQIAEINAKAARDELDLRKQFLEKEVQYEATSGKEVNDLRITRLKGQEDNPSVGQDKRFQLQQQVRQIELENINKEDLANKKLYQNKIISQEEYVNRSIALENERLGKQAEIDNAKQAEFYAKLKEYGDYAVTIAQDVADASFAINDNNIKQIEINNRAALDRDKAATLSQKFLTSQQKAVIEESYRRQAIAQERAAAVKKRDNDANQAEVDGFLAIAKVWAEHADNPILAAILSGIAIVNTLAQVQKIKSSPLPSFRIGSEYIEGPGTGTSDSIVARLSRGERVVTADINKRYFPALSAIHNEAVSPEVANDLMTATISPSIAMDQIEKQPWYQTSIDYDRLGESVARHMAGEISQLPMNHFSFDENGFVASVQKGLEKVTYLNKRYSSK